MREGKEKEAGGKEREGGLQIEEGREIDMRQLRTKKRKGREE